MTRFLQDTHDSSSCSSSVPVNTTGPLNSVPRHYDHFIVLLVGDISASPWAPNAPAGAQWILAHSGWENRFFWRWRCNTAASWNVAVSESAEVLCTWLYYVCGFAKNAEQHGSGILPYTEKYQQATVKQITCPDCCWQKTDKILLWDETHHSAFSGSKNRGTIKSKF